MDQSALAILNTQYQLPDRPNLTPKLKQLIRWLLQADPTQRPSICSLLNILTNWHDPLSVINFHHGSELPL